LSVFDESSSLRAVTDAGSEALSAQCDVIACLETSMLHGLKCSGRHASQRRFERKHAMVDRGTGDTTFRGEITMPMNMDDDGNPAADAYYETIASQEEIYLEETEERLRAILISYDPFPSRSIPEASNAPGMAVSPDEQLEHKAQELITGDSDDPPICNEAVVEMLKVSLIVRRLGPM